MGIKQPEHGNLERWCNEGVLLLNSILTVEKSKPASHSNMGWEQFTDKILSILNDLKETLFLFYGEKGPRKRSFLGQKSSSDSEKRASSPYSANNGFLGSKPFSKTNHYLNSNNIKEIDWDLN